MQSIINYRSQHQRCCDMAMYLFIFLCLSNITNNTFIRQNKQTYFVVSVILTFILQFFNIIISFLFLAQTSIGYKLQLDINRTADRDKIYIVPHIIIRLSCYFYFFEILLVYVFSYLIGKELL